MQFVHVDLYTMDLPSENSAERLREHVLGIAAASEEQDLSKLKPIARNFRQMHNSDPKGLHIWGIDRVLLNIGGGGGGGLTPQETLSTT